MRDRLSVHGRTVALTPAVNLPSAAARKPRISRRTAWLIRRVLFIPVAAFLVATFTFFLTNLIPSNPERAILGSTATRSAIQREKLLLGLNHGLIDRYVQYLKQLFLHGSLGHSYYGGRSVWADIGEYLPSSAELALLGLIIALMVGIVVGTIGAYFVNRPLDRILRVPVIIVLTTPDFFLGLIGIYFLFFKLGWLPGPTGQEGLLDPIDPGPTHAVLIDAIIHGNGALFTDALKNAILPAATLGISSSAFFMLITRSTVARALTSYQVEFARACGLPPRKVFAYAFLAARTQIITYVGILFASLVGSDVIIEQIFSWGGLGAWFVARANQLDLPEMEGIALVLSLITVGVFLLVDILVGLLDPRISYE
jgi:ABC-type dipeptide/oligopeptide/nickel transport system permease component